MSGVLDDDTALKRLLEPLIHLLDDDTALKRLLEPLIHGTFDSPRSRMLSAGTPIVTRLEAGMFIKEDSIAG